jgi:ABC-2 type transport system ATP-binding protein
MISVQNLTKTFGDRIAVNNVSFNVQKGEILGFLGPNGAGKTTTMRIITGFIPPTEGRVTIDNMDILEHPFEVKKKIGYMPEQPPLYYDMTVRECLGFVAEVHGMRGSRIDSSMNHVAELCGISQMLNRLTGNLSKGYRQRVGLAQALIHDPEILILDEPTAGLDPRQIIDIRNLIKDLGKERTVILSSHILPEVTNTCKRIAVINNGNLMAVDTIELLSDKLSSGKKIVLNVKRPEHLDMAQLSSITGVDDITKHSDHEFVLSVSGGDDVLEKISSSVVESGAGLTGIRVKSMDLEDIFLKIVTGEKVQ